MAESDDLDLKLALAVGAGLTIEATCEMLGVSTGTYYNRTAKNPHLFMAWRAFGELLWTKVYSADVAKAKTSEKAEDKIVSRLDKALQITDRILRKLEAKGDNADYADLMEAQKHITKWVADFAASRAPKRVQIEGEVKHEVRVAPTSLLQRLGAFALKNERFLPPPPEAIEAEVLS